MKIHFEFYHFLFPLALIFLLASLVTNKSKEERVRKTVSTLFIFLNVAILITPDSFLYKKLFNERYYWTEERIGVEHFQGKVPDGFDETAAVYPAIVGKFSRVYNYPSSIIFTADRNKESWLKLKLFSNTPKSITALENLLNHEKRHLDLTEVFRRKAMDSIEVLSFPSHKEKFRILEYFYNVSDSINDVFDYETGHGVNRLERRKWDNYLDKHLDLK